MQTYLDMEHMELVPDDIRNAPNACYLPHHAVVKQQDSKKKIRVVFNASFKTSNGLSLNDRLLTGPKLQRELWLVLTRWRFFRFVFTTDIVKMFRQIRIHEEDADLQQILWRKDQESRLKDYRLTTVTYGTACAPYLALRTLLQLAEDERERFPLGAKIIEDDTYVDDILAGADTLQQVQKAQHKIRDLLLSGGFPLSKWAVNCKEIHPAGDTSPRHFQEMDGISTLGLTWSPLDDSFSIRVSLLPPNRSTKRSVLSEVSRLFDPLGWIAPIVVIEKIMIQDLWLAEIDWDQDLPHKLSEQWKQFRLTLQDLEAMKIPRWISTCDDNAETTKLIGFCDASKRAYAATVYLHVEGLNGGFHSSLLVAKTKVAPVKTQSIPRLELCGALLLIRLLRAVSTGLNLRPVRYSHGPIRR